MKRQARTLMVLVTTLSVFVTGCAPSRPFYFFDDGDLSHYKGAATEIEYPDVNTVVLDDVTQASPPLTVANNEPREFWDLTLEEAMQNALANSKVMRSLGGTPVTSSNLLVASINNARVLQAPETYTTVYTPALRDSDPRFGTEAALSAFDAQLTSSLFWNQNDRPINLRPDLQIFARNVFRQDTTAFTSQIAKTSAAGTQFFARQSTNYEWNNNPSNEYPSVWQAAAEIEFTHPLLQGSGVDFNRIAGPNAVSGVYNGVTIARINTDIALTDFEIGVRNLVNDVENAYWNLYFAYRRLDANVVGRDSSLVTWRKVHAMAAAGAADAAQEAQAREQYFLFRGNVETALSDMYSAESALRYMMGLAATDGRLVRPADEPTTAKIVFDWTEANQESLSRSIELRRQRWMIKRRELELAASKNFLLPRLDADAIYRWRGLGDDLISSNGGGKRPSAYAWDSLLSGNYQEWQMGFNFSMPLGFRQALAGVRNAQLQLARDRAILQEQELEQSHLLSESIRFLDRAYMLSQTNFNRRAAAIRQVQAVQQNYEVGRITLDQLLDAQRRLADAEQAYFQSLADYNRAIAAVHYRKGSLLEYNAVHLAEGPWASKAYFDARERARARDAGIFLNYGFTRPGVFSQGPVDQGLFGGDYIEGEVVPSETMLEESELNDAAPNAPTIAPPQGDASSPSPTPALKAVPMSAPEGRATSFDSALVEDPNDIDPSKDSASAFVAASRSVKQTVRQTAYEETPPQPIAQYEGRQGRTAAGISRSATVGSGR
ncbi:MAG: TolC family protein [Planctomycetales bacterium]|nr:TolC family protein [Planctomycetales bacterium]